MACDIQLSYKREWGCFLPNMYNFATGLKAIGEAKIKHTSYNQEALENVWVIIIMTLRHLHMRLFYCEKALEGIYCKKAQKSI